MTMTRDEITGTWVAEDGSHWKRIRNGRNETTGWLEVFGSRRAGYVSVPGASRWMDNATGMDWEPVYTMESRS